MTAVRRVLAAILGVGFLTVGLLRLFPVAALPAFSRPEYVHGAVHLVTGAAYAWAAVRADPGRLRAAVVWLGVGYLAFGMVGLAGFLDYSDNAIHAGAGAASVIVGLLGRERDHGQGRPDNHMDVNR